MLKSLMRWIWLPVVTAVLCVPTPSLAAYNYIDITNPALRKVPLAVPYFKAMTPGDAEQISREAADYLASCLNFTDYFKIIDRGAYLVAPDKIGIVGPEINFRDWTAIGAELLITGGVKVEQNQLEMQLRLFDTFKQKLLVGRLYKGILGDEHRIIRRFCDEVIYKLTGKWGIFESRIAFLSTGTGHKEIYICDFDGSNPVQWTHYHSITLSPAWSSDGKFLAFTSYYRGNPDLYIRPLGQGQGAVVAKKGVNISPAWVPGQFALAATLSFSGNSEIYLLTGYGKVVKKLVSSWGINVSPAWSPDGKKLAFVSNRDGSPQIYIKDMASGTVTRLTFQGDYNTTPSWSPNGDRIAYTASEDGHFEIMTIGIDGSNLQQLTKDSGDNESPSWSPDGSLIVFSSTREGVSRLYVMTALGADQRRLLKLPGAQSMPRWSPRVIDN